MTELTPVETEDFVRVVVGCAAVLQCSVISHQKSVTYDY